MGVIEVRVSIVEVADVRRWLLGWSVIFVRFRREAQTVSARIALRVVWSGSTFHACVVVLRIVVGGVRGGESVGGLDLGREVSSRGSVGIFFFVEFFSARESAGLLGGSSSPRGWLRLPLLVGWE